MAAEISTEWEFAALAPALRAKTKTTPAARPGANQILFVQDHRPGSMRASSPHSKGVRITPCSDLGESGTRSESPLSHFSLRSSRPTLGEKGRHRTGR